MNRNIIKKRRFNIRIIILIFIIIYFIKVNQYAYRYLRNKDKIEKNRSKSKSFLFWKSKEKGKSKGNNKKPKPNILYNKCIFTKVPKVSGILETAEYLRYHNNKSLIRYGNGEINLMLMKKTPFQMPDEKLSEELIKAFTNNNPDVMIGIRNIFTGYPGERKQSVNFWVRDYQYFERYMLKMCNMSKRYFDAFITSPYTSTYNTSCELVDLVYKELREVWRDKDLVILRGNNSQVYDYDVYDTARSQTILYSPRTNVWDDYDRLKRLLLSQDPSALYIIAAGPVSEVFVMDLVKDNRRALDMGHLAKDYNSYMKKEVYTDEFWVD